MKEATGELNSTVIVVLAVGVFVAFFFSYLWPMIKGSMDLNSKCSDAICEPCNKDVCDYVKCHLKESPDKTFECVYKG